MCEGLRPPLLKIDRSLQLPPRSEPLGTHNVEIDTTAQHRRNADLGCITCCTRRTPVSVEFARFLARSAPVWRRGHPP
jgi:hypothetical protein